MNIKKLCGYPV